MGKSITDHSVIELNVCVDDSLFMLIDGINHFLWNYFVLVIL